MTVGESPLRTEEINYETVWENDLLYGKRINSDSFKLGVLFVLSKLNNTRTKGCLLKDKSIAQLQLGESVLSAEDICRINLRFGIV